MLNSDPRWANRDFPSLEGGRENWLLVSKSATKIFLQWNTNSVLYMGLVIVISLLTVLVQKTDVLLCCCHYSAVHKRKHSDPSTTPAQIWTHLSCFLTSEWCTCCPSPSLWSWRVGPSPPPSPKPPPCCWWVCERGEEVMTHSWNLHR